MTTYNFGMENNMTLKDQLKTIKELGFDGVECALTPEAYELMQEYGLKAKNSNRGVQPDGSIANLDILEKLGVTCIQTSFMYYDRETALRAAEKLNADGKIAKKYGFKAYIHNHTQEFTWNDVEKEYCWETVLHNIDPELAGFQLDAGWAQIAGVDVINLLQKYGDMVLSLHVKPCTAILGPAAVDYLAMPRPTPGKPMDTKAIDKMMEPINKAQTAMENCLRSYGPIMELAESKGCSSFIVERDCYYKDRLEVLKEDIATLRKYW